MTKKKLSKVDTIFEKSNIVLLMLFVLMIIIPLFYVLIASLMDPVTLSNQGISLDFSKWTLDGYKRVFKDNMLLIGFRNSVFYSVTFTVISVGVTLLAAYPLSLQGFVGKKFFNTIFIFTMFFSGGLMPTYLLIDKLHMLNTVWSVILPGTVNVWNIILARTYYKGISKELREAAKIDGASDIQYFFKILMPICKPIIAVLVLYQFVAQWNSYFDAMIYLKSADLQPLQLVIRSILVQNTPHPGMIADIQNAAAMAKIAELLKYSTIVVSSLPLLIMYPFFQKYFEKGMMAGSVKG